MDLFETLAKGDIAALKAGLAADPDAASSRNASGASLLAWAAYNRNADAIAAVRGALPRIDAYEAIIVGDTDAVRDALDHGWNGNTLSPDGFTPLGLAAFFGQMAVFDLLLPLTQNVNETAKNAQHVAALHAATSSRNTAMVEKLLRAGADPNLLQADGFTALHAAAQHGDAAIVALLLLFGGNPRTTNAKGLDAVAHARAGGHEWLAVRLEAQR